MNVYALEQSYQTVLQNSCNILQEPERLQIVLNLRPLVQQLFKLTMVLNQS